MSSGRQQQFDGDPGRKERDDDDGDDAPNWPAAKQSGRRFGSFHATHDHGTHWAVARENPAATWL